MSVCYFRTVNMASHFDFSVLEEIQNELDTESTITEESGTSASAGQESDTKVKHLFNSLEVQYKVLELDKLANGAEIQEALFEITGHRTVPNVFINGKHLGGAETTVRTHEQGRLLSMIMPPTQQYDYDLCVIGGGSGGLAAAKQAAKLGKKVVLLDFVKPSPKGTTWGLGGTCVNVGCIPKKLMHQASLLGESLVDAKHYGWQVNKSEVAHNWQEMTEAVQNHIGSVNWNYRVQLRTKEVTYVNGYGEFVDDHTVKAIGRRNKETIITAERFVLAMGMRPRYDNIPGVKECSITSDDLFSLPYSPGKTLCVGASYVSLECAGFLAGLGMDVTVMVRSILLRGFDQQMAEKVGAYMENHGVKFIRGAVPTKLEQIEEGQPGVIRVHAKTTDGEDIVGDYNTVLYAIGRDACTTELGLEKLNVQLNPKNKKIVCNDADQSSVSHIYAIGDILDGRPELTPVAVQAGKLLAKRLFGGSTVLTDYVNVATTVFTPLEYGACGYSEEDAIDKFGAESIEVYHVNFWPLEFTVAQKSEKDCYAKLICNKLDSLRVVGLHILGPNAGEITQGYSVAIKMGATKDDFDTTIGIHPTVAEVFTTMEITKGSGEPFATAGC